MKLFFLILLLCFFTGCTKQYLTVDSSPSGAKAEINGRFVGKTPVVVSYIETGHFRVRLQKSGFKTLDTKFKIKKKWFNYPLIDFFAEAIPVRWTSKKNISFILKETVPSDPIKIKQKANKILHKND